MEADLQKTKSSASSQLDTIASLEDSLKQARAAESEAKQRFIELQEQIEKSTVLEDTDKVKELEKKIETLRAQDKKLSDTISKLESSEKDLISCRKELGSTTKELADKNIELKASKSELVKVQESEEELKKKMLSLEEALSKANNDLGKSQVTITFVKEVLHLVVINVLFGKYSPTCRNYIYSGYCGLDHVRKMGLKHGLAGTKTSLKLKTIIICESTL